MILNAYGHGLAYDKLTGNIVWGTNSPVAGLWGLASPFAATIGTQRTVVILNEWNDPDKGGGFIDLRVEGIDPANGNRLWWAASTWSVGPYADPIICNGKIRISSGHMGGEGAYDLEIRRESDGRLTNEVWHAGTMTSLTTPVLLDGYLYGVDYNYTLPAPELGKLRCEDPTIGKVMWASAESYNEHRGGGACGAIMAAGGELVVLSAEGWLSVVDATSAGYAVVHSNAHVNTDYDAMTPFATAPTIANGVLYVRGNYNTLSAYRVGIRPPVIAMVPKTNQADIVELSWRSDSETTYDVYKSTNLLAGWPAQPYTNFVGDGSAKSFSDPMATQRSAYYRIKAR